MNLIGAIIETTISTFLDVLPVAAILLGFQVFVLRQKPRHLYRIIIGLVCVLIGLSFFLVGLGKALFPLGDAMARQLTAPEFTGQSMTASAVDWRNYIWVYVFAATIGFATTVAEPSLIAVAVKVEEVASGGISAWGLRLAVAIGVGIGVAVGTYRIVSGTPLSLYIMAGYAVVIFQTFRASKMIIPLAYDSGGVTTSTVTVPVLAALGLGLAAAVPGRSPLIDGFGLIAFASVFPIMSVLGYDMVAIWLRRRQRSKSRETADEERGQ